MSLFEGRRPYPVTGQAPNLIIPFAAVRGTAIMRDVTDPSLGDLAEAQLLGFLGRDVVEGGPTLDQRAGIWSQNGGTDPELELPDAVDTTCALELWDAYEAEGSDYILQSGTGYLSNETTIGTLISFVDGVARVKQTNDLAYYILTGHPTPEVDGNVRAYFERIRS